MDAETLFAQLEFNTGEFPEHVLAGAIDQKTSIVPGGIASQPLAGQAQDSCRLGRFKAQVQQSVDFTGREGFEPDFHQSRLGRK